MDVRAECMVACLDGKKQACIALLKPLGIVVRERTIFIVNGNRERVAFDRARSYRRKIWPSGLSSSNTTPNRTTALVSKVMRPLAMRTIKDGEQLWLVATA